MKKVLAVVLSLMMVFSMLPIVSSANTDAVTHQNFLNASERYEKFVTRNAGVPNYVTAGTQRFTAWDYLYAAADAIVDLAGGSSIAVTYKSVAAVAEKNAREDITSGEMLRGEYVALAEAVVEAVDTNNAVPACFGTTLGAVSPKNVSYIFAQILSYYKNNKTLPASVQVDPWVGAFYSKPSTAPEQVGTTSATILASRLMSAAMRVKTATDTNGALPTLVEVDGQVLSMGQFLATAAKVYLSGKTVGEVEVTFADTPEYPVEDMTALTLSKAELDELVTAIDNAMGTTAPASVTYNGSVIGFNTLVYTVASALAQIATNGIVESITVPTWEEISGTALPAPGTEPTSEPSGEENRVYSLSSVVSMANRVITYLVEWGTPLKYTFVSLELTKLDDAQAALTMANVVKDLGELGEDEEYAGTVVYEGLKAADFETKEKFTPGDISKAGYLAVADSFVAYAEENGNNLPETVWSEIGGLGFESVMILFARVLSAYGEEGVLPESVTMDKEWWEICFNPVATPDPTEAPATEAPATQAPATQAPATTAPTTAPDGIFTIAELAAAAKTALEGYTSGTPFYKEGITVDGLTVAQQNYYVMAAQAIQDIYNNNTTATYANASANYNVPTLVANYTLTMTDGSDATEASQNFYMNFAIRQTSYVNGAGAGTVGASALYPTGSGNANGFPVTDYTGQMTYEAGLLMFTRILAAYAANGSLPASVALEYVPATEATEAPATEAPATEAPATQAPATQAPATTAPTTAPDGIFTIAELAAAAKTALEGYTSGTPFYKEGITVDGLTVAQQNYYVMAAQAIQDIYNNNTTATYANASANYNVPNLVANYTLKMTDGSDATTASQAFYMNFAIRQTIYVNGTGAGTVGASAGYPTGSGNANGFPVTDYTGQMTYEAGLLMFTRILAAYADNGSLPNSVALEYVPATEATEAPATEAPATEAPATQAPATQAPAAYPTQYPTLSTIANGTTFTVADIAAAASQIVSHYETYKELDTEYSMPKAVTVAGQTMTDQDWAYIAGYAINGLSGAWSASGLSGYTASSTVAYKKMAAASKNANDTYTGTSVAIAKVAEISWKNMSNYGNINSGVSASCGTAFPGYQVSYYSALLLEARALEYYSTNGSLPATVAYDSVSFVITDSDSYVEAPEATQAPAETEAPATEAPATQAPAAHPTQYPTLSTISNGTTFTVAEIAAAASQIVSHYETYKELDTEYSIAKAVTVAGKTMKDQDWAYLAGYAINGVSGLYASSGLSGYTASSTVAYKKMTAASVNANNGYSGTTVTMAKVAEIAWKNMSNFGNNNGGVSASCGSALSGAVSYYSALLLEARALEYYSINGTLPASVTFDALHFITADSDTYVE